MITGVHILKVSDLKSYINNLLISDSVPPIILVTLKTATFSYSSILQNQLFFFHFTKAKF